MSKGSLPNVSAPAVVSAAAGKLQFTWADNTGAKKKALSSDLVFVAAYNHDLDEWEYVEKAAARNAGTYTMDVIAFSGKTVQAYVGVLHRRQKKCIRQPVCRYGKHFIVNDISILTQRINKGCLKAALLLIRSTNVFLYQHKVARICNPYLELLTRVKDKFEDLKSLNLHSTFLY